MTGCDASTTVADSGQCHNKRGGKGMGRGQQVRGGRGRGQQVKGGRRGRGQQVREGGKRGKAGEGREGKETAGEGQ